jgi:hypothetical protein
VESQKKRRAAPEDLRRHAIRNLEQADALLFGWVIYEMMEATWRPPAQLHDPVLCFVTASSQDSRASTCPAVLFDRGNGLMSGTVAMQYEPRK